MSITDHLIYIFMAIRDFYVYQIERYTVATAIMFFFPLVLFFELPRYFIPTLMIPVLKLLGVSRTNTAAEEDFIKLQPSVSIIVAGRNEEKIISGTIDSLLALKYPNKEIIVIDDNSDDDMYAICKKYADRGDIRLFRNSAVTGRAGRPVASNLGLRVATGEFIISVDADTSYDYDIINRMLGPFYDPKVGAVAGNIKVRNLGVSFWTDCQAIEYALSIGLWKRWTSFIGTTLQASGAFGAFRREALLDFYGWDPELAEDADLSLKIRKCGWEIEFAPYAIAMTNVPDTLYVLARQRIRWDKGAVRTYFHKHKNIMNFRRFPFKNFFELAQEWLMIYILPFAYVVYLVVMIFFDWQLLVFALSMSYLLYVAMAFFALMSAISLSERRSSEWFLLWYVPLFPFYKEIFRWVRLYANIMETFRWKYKESYIPESGYTGEKW